MNSWRRQWHPTPVLLPGKSHGWKSLVGCSPWGHYSRTRLSDFTFTFPFHALEKAMATHSSALAWRIPGTAEPGGLPSMGSQSQTRLKQLSSSICLLELCCGCSVAFMSNSLRSHGLQYTRLSCPPLSPWICPSSCPLSQWGYLTISSSATLLSFCLQSFPASGSFPMNRQIFMVLKVWLVSDGSLCFWGL